MTDISERTSLLGMDCPPTRAGRDFPAATALAFAMLAMIALAGCASYDAAPEKASSVSVSSVSAPPVALPVSDLPEPDEAEIEAELDDGAVPDFNVLAPIMGDDEAAKLIAEAETDPVRRWIAAHPDAIAFEGEAVQMKLLTLAADDDAAVQFVKHFPDLYPSEGPLDIEGVKADGKRAVPQLYQWDQRWGYTVYSSTAFGLTGCGPTAFAMAYQGVTGQHDRSPYDMSLLSQELGCMEEFEGTSNSFFYQASSNFGMNCESIPIDESQLRSELDQGHVVIANMAHGYFSHFDGHFLVLVGIDDGKLILNDPYSVVHSQQTWDIDFILSESKGMYSFSRA